jgi:hypothetical protein
VRVELEFRDHGTRGAGSEASSSAVTDADVDTGFGTEFDADAGVGAPEPVPMIGRSSSLRCTGALEQISAESGQLIK